MKKSKVAPTVSPAKAVELTAAQRYGRMRDSVRRIIYDFATDDSVLQSRRDTVRKYLDNGYMMDWSTIHSVVIEEQRRHAIEVSMLTSVEKLDEKTLEELLQSIERLHESCIESVMMNARSASSGGEMNSTDAFSRAIGAATVAAKAKLYEETKNILHTAELLDEMRVAALEESHKQA